MPSIKLTRGNTALLCILFLALILRLINLGSKSLWLDETVNIQMAGKSIFSWGNTLPPLYFAVLHFWLKIGKSEIIVRSLSVILGVLSVYIIYKIGLIVYSKNEALISAFLLSISSTAIIFSQFALYYSLFIPLSLLSVYFLLKMEQKPTNSNKAFFLFSIVLSFYSHYFTILLLFVFIIFMLWKYKNEKDFSTIKSFLLVLGIFCLLIAPIIPIFISQTLVKAQTTYIDYKYEFHISNDFIKEIFTYLIINEYYEKDSVLFYIILGLFLYGVFSSFTVSKKSTIFLLAWLFIPIASAAILANIISNLQIRYIVFVLPALLLITSRGIVAIAERRKSPSNIRNKLTGLNSLAIVLVLLVITISSYPILDMYYKSENYDWRSTAKFLETNAEDGSNIVLIPGYNIVPFSYYYSENRTNVLEYSSFDALSNLSYRNNTYVIISTDAMAIKPDELAMLRDWMRKNTEIKANLGYILVFKNTTKKN